MSKPILLDLFCGAGGAAKGYADTGFEVIGVDIEHHEDFPYEFYVGEALETLDTVIADSGLFDGVRVNAVHTSPPCQAYSSMTPDKSKHPELVEPVRERLQALERIGIHWVIENVQQAPLINPTKLCGSMFPNDGLRVRRHRLFETSFTVHELKCNHKRQGQVVGVYGSHWDSREFLRPDGTRRGAKASSLEDARDAMGIDWMVWEDLKESIPPAYTRWIGRHLMGAVEDTEERYARRYVNG